MKRIKSVLIRTQPSGKSFLLTLKQFNRPLVNEFRSYLKQNKIEKFFTGNFAQIISQRTLSVGFEVSCAHTEMASEIIEQSKKFCIDQNLNFVQQKMKLPGHHDADETPLTHISS